MKIPNAALSVVMAFALFHQAVGCTAYSRIDPKTWDSDKKKGYENLHLLNKRTVRLDKDTLIRLLTLTGVIVGRGGDGIPVVLSLDSLAEMAASEWISVPVEEAGDVPLQAVVTTGGRTVKFQEPGGRFDSVQQLILGKSDSGEPVRLKASLVQSVLVKRPVAVSRDDLIATRPVVRRVKTASGSMYVFDDGASYRDSVCVVSVTSKDGRNILVPVDEIKHVAKPDGAGAGLVVVSVIALLAITIAIIQAEMDAMFDGINWSVE
jgi:hypothetical protein